MRVFKLINKIMAQMIFNSNGLRFTIINGSNVGGTRIKEILNIK